MERNIKKLIEEYNHKYMQPESKRGQISASDIYQIADISQGNAYSMITNALAAGIMIGYRLAKKEAKESKA